MELLCTKCRETKPDAEFSTARRNSLRRGRASWCKACYAARAAEIRAANPERSTAIYRRWLAANRERERERVRIYQATYPDRVLLTREKGKLRKAANEKRRRIEDPASAQIRVMKHRASKLRATPVWADAEIIGALYRLARCYIDAGIDCHVDHIVPLQSKSVCGLHVQANLQLLPGRDNIVKGNRHWPDMACA